jgi:hypothetical protein
MKNSQNNIDRLISKILSEEINAKSKEIIEEMSEEWTEIEMDEDLTGNQSKIDVAEPKGKITAADFKKLRGSQKEETEEDYDFDEDRDDFDGRPGKVIGVYSNIKKQRDMEEAECNECGDMYEADIDDIMNEIEGDVEFKDEVDDIKESIQESLNWFKKFKNYN